MASDIVISADKKSVTPAEAAALYIELGWGTKKEYSVVRMKRSLAHCDIVVSARNAAGELVGIGRALSDFAIDTKILDLVIAPEYQRQGLGQAMMKKIASLAKGTSIYFETERKNFAFAAKCGYEKRGGLTVFRKKG
ncbi:MAG TPA: GNAT family N-acetyltransferase [Candidatus Paceibacterota bacterium]|nr:GNAT family N-acetyltransferase [Candidatus Paceibacterota bacterium]